MFFKSRPGTIDLKRIKISTCVQCRRPPKGGFFVPENPFPNILPNMFFALVLDMRYLGFLFWPPIIEILRQVLSRLADGQESNLFFFRLISLI